MRNSLCILALGGLWLAGDAAATKPSLPTQSPGQIGKRCRPGHRLIFAGTRSERCVPNKIDRCKPGQIRIMAKCARGARRCPSMCINKPNPGGGRLCPPGKVWKDTCPPGAMCIIGGLCVDKDEGKPGAKKCPKGTKLTRVMCIRAPCPALCLPVGGLRPIPLVRPLPLKAAP